MAPSPLRAVAAAGLLSAARVAAEQQSMFTLTGACDADAHLDGMDFAIKGYTLNGAPFYQGINSNVYIYYDTDCQGSGDGQPRWIIDNNVPSVTRESDLDGDGACSYLARVDSEDRRQPPRAGEWQMYCAGEFRTQFLILLDLTTTPSTPAPSVGPAKATTTTTTMAANSSDPAASSTPRPTSSPRPMPPPKHLELTGACYYKRGLNGLIFSLVGSTASGAPYYKADGADEYLYYDPDCDGPSSSQGGAHWVIDHGRPSTVATSDLDGDGRCNYHARMGAAVSDVSRPPNAATWRMYCGPNGWQDVQLSLREVEVGTSVAPGLTNGAARSSLMLASSLGLLAVTRYLL